MSDPEDRDLDLSHLLAGERLPSATADGLEAVLERHRRRHLRALSGAVVVSLVAASLGLLAGGSFGGGQSRVQAGAGPAGKSSAPVSSSTAYASALQFPQAKPYKHLFIRTTGSGVAVRAFVQTMPPPSTQLPPACAPGTHPAAGWTGYAPLSSGSGSASGSASPGPAAKVTKAAAAAAAKAAAATATAAGNATNCMPRQVRQHLLACMPKVSTTMLFAELSNKEMVGMAVLPMEAKPAGSLEAVSTSVIGALEGSPVAVVDLRTGPGVAKAEAVFTGGKTDSMAPVGGFAVLAAPVPASASSPYGGSQVIGTLKLLSASGAVLADQTLRQGMSPSPAQSQSYQASSSCGSVAPMVSVAPAARPSSHATTTTSTTTSVKAP
ncbi:MAG: hypothetical protein ACYDH5_16620 [Acidimicrobiales bacterium]